MAQVTVKNGIQSATIEISEGTTVRELISNPVTQAIGVSDNVDAKISGEIVDPSVSLFGGEVVSFSQRASSKA